MDQVLKARLSQIRHVALDMDGTIYMGSQIFPFTIPFLQKLTRLGITYSFLTNNPSSSLDDYLAKLHRMGIEATEEEMYTTTVATIDYIHAHYPEAKRLFLLGTPSMISQFEKAGFISTADDPDDVPDIIVAAFDKSLVYPRLCRAAWWIAQGIPYIATNPDKVCPPMSAPSLSTAAVSARASRVLQAASPISRSASQTPICSLASSSSEVCSPPRLPWSAIASIPILKWHKMPIVLVCSYSLARPHSRSPRVRPIRPTSRFRI